MRSICGENNKKQTKKEVTATPHETSYAIKASRNTWSINLRYKKKKE